MTAPDPITAEERAELTLAEISELVGDDIEWWLGNLFLSPEEIAGKVQWWVNRAVEKRVAFFEQDRDAALAEKRDLRQRIEALVKALARDADVEWDKHNEYADIGDATLADGYGGAAEALEDASRRVRALLVAPEGGDR